MTPAELIDFFKHRPLKFEPGTAFSYSNSNYVLLGEIIEAVSGQSYEAYLHHELLKPLGMLDSGYGRREAAHPQRANGYTLDRDRDYIEAVPVHLSVLYDANSGYWCQAGIEAYRYDGHPFVEQYTYLERQGTSRFPAVFPGPGEGDEFNIGCLLDPATGTWYLSMSGLTIISLPPDAGWVNRSGTRVDVTGELRHHECDMFGTEGWLMRLSNLEINGGSDWSEAPSLSVPRTNSLYIDEWNMFVADSGIFLYDMQPLPL